MDDYSSGFQPTYKTVDEVTSDYWDLDEENVEAAVSPTTKSVITLIICIIGLIGNLTVIFVVTTLKEYRKSVTNWYILQLAIADLLFVLTLPFLVSEYIQDAWIYSEWLCKAMNTIRFHNYYASILFFTVMSIDRYVAVCHPLSKRLNQFRERKSAAIITVLIWITALLLCIPIMLYSFKIGIKPGCFCGIMFPLSKAIQTENEDECRKENVTDIVFQECLENQTRSVTQQRDVNCIEDSDQYYASSDYDYFDDNQIPQECLYDGSSNGWFTFIWFNFAAMFIFPFTIMCICYGLIIYRVSSSKMLSRTNSTSSQAISRQSRKRKQVAKSNRDKVRVTRMCAILVMSFLLSWILFHATHIAKIVGIRNATGSFCIRLALASSFIAYLNSALNPYLYSFLDHNFKERFQKAARVLLRKDVFSSKKGFQSQRSNSKRKSSISKSSASETTKFSRLFTGRKSLSSNEQPLATESQSNPMLLQVFSPVNNLPTDQIYQQTTIGQDEKT